MNSDNKLRNLNFSKELNIAHNFFINNFFDIEIINSENFIASKKGKIFMFFKYTDYYFIRSSKTTTTNTLEDFHIDSIFKVNKKIKTPKLLRISIPNINTITITNSVPGDDVIKSVSKRRVSLKGGQQESLFIVSLLSQKLFSAGKNITSVKGEAKLVFGNKKEFKTLNGNNRAFYLISELSNALFNSINKSILQTLKH
jgi:hypothetical protein